MKSILQEALSAETFRENGHHLVDMLADYFEKVSKGRDLPVLDWKDPLAARENWKQELSSTEKKSPDALFEEIIKKSIHLHHPKYMGHQLSPVAPMAALAGLLTDFLNNGTGIYEMGAPGSMMEFSVIDTVAKAMRLNENAGGFLTSGGTLANLTAMLAARSHIPESNIWKEGQKTKLALMVTEEAHYSVDRAARIMGWGEEGVIKIPSDDRFRMRTELLPEYYAKAKEEGITIIAVVGSACSTATGSFDDLEAIGAFCKKHKLWFHVDAAHGGALCFSDQYRHLLKGIEQADSVIMDFHKMLLTPVITTAIIFKEKSHCFETFSQKAKYLFQKSAKEEWFNLALRTFECTKNSMAIKVYSLLHTYGTELFDEFVTKICSLGKKLGELLDERDKFELAVKPECNIVCFRIVPEGLDEQQINQLNSAIREKILKEGEFYIVQTSLKGSIYLRTTLGSPNTSEKELAAMLDKVEETGIELQKNL